MKHFRTLCCLFLIAIFSMGCMVGPNYKKPDLSVPNKWKNSSQKKFKINNAKKNSMHAFNDKTLDQLIHLAIKNNLDLKIATTRVLEARANRLSASAKLFPDTKIASYASRRNPGFISFNKVFNITEATFDASWELDFFGGQRRKVEAQNALVDASIESKHDVLLTLVAEVATNYIDLRLYQKQLAISKSNTYAAQDTFHLTQSLRRAGVVSDLDASQAEALYLSFKSNIPTYESQIEATKNRITTLLGLYPGELDSLLQTRFPVIPHANQTVILQTPTEVIRQRPDVREAERKLASSTALEGSAIADWFPKLSLGGYYGTQKTTLMPGQGIWSITPDLSIPLFNFGRIQSQVDFSKAQAQEAFFTYKKTVISALEEVETHLTELVNVQKRYQLLKQSARANQTAVTLASERYQKGISNFINVLNSEQDLYSTENQTASAEAEQAKKVVAIYKSLGQNVWDEQQID